MKDTVWRCGHTSHLMDEVNTIQDAPQIHLHWLTPERDPETRIEICCHGCGASLTMRYKRDWKDSRHIEVKDSFVNQHRSCPDRGYRTYCPDWRTSFQILDLRPKPKVSPPLTRKMPVISMLQSVGARESRHAGRTEGSRRRG